jgi:His-Xaa-Ser repeat protein HxsA
MFGLGAAAVAAPVAYAIAAPPVYYTAAPSVGYYNPPQTVVVEKQRRVVHEVHTAPQSDLLAKAQSKLSALGYYKGNIDGNFGPQTELAITKFQGENGLSMTGRLDLKTLSSLGITL